PAISPALTEARRELDEARRLDPQLAMLSFVTGELALMEQRYGQAEASFRQAMRDDPELADNIALPTAFSIIANPQYNGSRSAAIKALVDQYPKNGDLAALYAGALATEEKWRAANDELQRARALGADPSKVLPSKVVSEIETRATPGLLDRF